MLHIHQTQKTKEAFFSKSIEIISQNMYSVPLDITPIPLLKSKGHLIVLPEGAGLITGRPEELYRWIYQDNVASCTW